jgi:hypothetical protein
MTSPPVVLVLVVVAVLAVALVRSGRLDRVNTVLVLLSVALLLLARRRLLPLEIAMPWRYALGALGLAGILAVWIRARRRSG